MLRRNSSRPSSLVSFTLFFGVTIAALFQADFARADAGLDAYNFALTYVGNPELAGDLEHWSAKVAYFGRAMAKIRLGMTDISNDMDAMGAYSVKEFPSVCPAD